MKNNDRPVKEEIDVKLSGVVTAQSFSPNCSTSGVWKGILISSFVETRFQNVLRRATLLQRTSWFWHRECSIDLCDRAIAIIACSSNDYRQLLIKQNQLANAVIELDPEAELLLLISPIQDYVFATVLETGEIFSTHILFRQQSGDCSQRLRRKEITVNNSVPLTVSRVAKQGVMV